MNAERSAVAVMTYELAENTTCLYSQIIRHNSFKKLYNII
jgi:hypothetical protein